MAKTENTQGRLNQIVGPIIAIGLLAYFIYHIIQGERGVLSMMRLQQKIAVAEEELNAVQKQHDVLNHRVQLLKPDSLDPDMLEERARSVLNFARKDELVIYDNELKKTG